MPFDPSGNFTRVHNWQQDRDNGIRILADRHDAEDDNFAAAFNQVFLRGGIVPMTGDLNMGGFNINTIKAGSAAAPSLTWELSPNTGLFQPNPASVSFSSNGVEKVQMNALGMGITGKLGIGTLAPVWDVHVTSPAADAIVFVHAAEAAGLRRAAFMAKSVLVNGSLQAFGATFPTTEGVPGNSVILGGDGPNGLYHFGKNCPIVFGNGNVFTERMRIDNAGNVGIGVPAPNAKLHIKGADAGTLTYIEGATSLLRFYSDAASGPVMQATDQLGGLNKPLSFVGDSFRWSIAGVGEKMRLANTGELQLPQYTGFGSRLHVADLIASPATWDASRGVSIGESSGNTGYYMRMGTFLDVGVWTGFVQNLAAAVPAPMALNPGGGYVAVGDELRLKSAIGVAAGIRFMPGGVEHGKLSIDANGAWLFEINGVQRMVFASDASSLYPQTDGGTDLGGAANRWATVYATVGTINTSDAREKSPLTPLTANELAAARAIVASVGTYTWLDKALYDDKKHVGVTAQAVIEVMAAHGLDALIYGFVQYDEWEAVPAVEAVEGSDAVIDKDGKLIKEPVQQVTGVPGREAGNRYGLNYAELSIFLAAAQEQRLAVLEAAAANPVTARKAARKKGEL